MTRPRKQMCADCGTRQARRKESMTIERENEILKNLLHHAVMELSYVHSAEHISQTDSAHGRRTVDAGMAALGLRDLSDDSIIGTWPIEVSEWEQKANLEAQLVNRPSKGAEG